MYQKFTPGFLLTLLCSLCITLSAQDGQLDGSFGSGGKVWDPSSTYPVSVYQEATVPRILVQPDGKIIHVGPTASVGLVITRYLPGGAIDATFGSGGSISYNDVQTVYQPRNAYMLADGKFFVIGESRVNPFGAEHGFALIKFNQNGTLDNSFSGDGKAVIPLASSNPVAHGIAVQPDGKIIVVGSSPGQFTTVRHNPDGSADTGFDGDGVVKTTLSAGGSETAYAVTVAADGKILVAGQVTNLVTEGPYTYYQHDLGIIRYNPDGSIDMGFGNGGDVTLITSQSTDYARSIAISPSDNKIIVSGFFEIRTDPDYTGMYVAKFLPNGTLDGNATYVTMQGRFRAVDMVMQTDEKVIVSGYSLCPGGCAYQGWVDIHVRRFTKAGALDNTFNPARVEYQPTYPSTPGGDGSIDVGGSLAGQGTKLITGGLAKYSGQTKNFLVRLQNSVGLLPRNPLALTPPINYVTIPAKIEAEAFSTQSGTQTENTSDAGGGQNIGWIDNGDWLKYDIHVPTAGTYTLNLRVASFMTGAEVGVFNQGGAQIATASVPNTGGWQNWITVPVTVNLTQGNQTIELRSVSSSSWNINWLEFTQSTTPPPSNYVTIPAKIEAEAFVNQSGTQTENTSDVGGGQNVGWIDMGDFLEYNISVPTAGTYTFNARVASQMSGANINIRIVNGSVLADLAVPNTNGWQNWTTVSTSFNLPAGNHTLRLTSSFNSSWNINWLELTQGSTPPPPPGHTLPKRVQAEDYSSMQGIQTETTSDVGGGLNIGWIDAGDHMYYVVNSPTATTYKLSYRVASQMSGATFEVRTQMGTLLDQVTVPNTNGWQNWVTVEGATISLPQGSTMFRIMSTSSASWNINWIDILHPTTPPPPPSTYTVIPGIVQAENYSAMSGIQTENTSDAGGGQNVGYIDYDDWMEYKITVQAGATFGVQYRVATPNSNARFIVTYTNEATGASETTAMISIPQTGGYQTWTSFNQPNNQPLAAGNYTVRITSKGDAFNINYIQFINVSSMRVPGDIDVVESAASAELSAFPNPVRDLLNISLNNEKSGRMEVSFVNTAGVVVKTLSLNKEKGAFRTSISTAGLRQGQYLLRINMNGVIETRKIIKM